MLNWPCKHRAARTLAQNLLIQSAGGRPEQHQENPSRIHITSPAPPSRGDSRHLASGDAFLLSLPVTPATSSPTRWYVALEEVVYSWAVLILVGIFEKFTQLTSCAPYLFSLLVLSVAVRNRWISPWDLEICTIMLFRVKMFVTILLPVGTASISPFRPPKVVFGCTLIHPNLHLLGRIGVES